MEISMTFQNDRMRQGGAECSLRMARRFGAALCVTLVAAACGRNEETAKDQAATKTDAGASAMADMPGMAVPAEGGGKADDRVTVATEVLLSAAQVQHGGVRWERLTLATTAAAAVVPGQVVPNEDRTARLGAPAGGRVVAVRVAPGDRVAPGAMLVTLQSPEAGMAQSDVAKADAEVASRRAQATYARAARERAERLLALKAIPRQDYERAIADDELASASLTQAEAELRRARSTAKQLGAGSSVTGEIAIRSPLAGVVLARTAVPGAVVEAGSPLVVVTDPSTLWLSINAPEKLASLFRVGGRLRFTVPAYPADTFSARVDAVGAGLDPETRTLTVRALVPNGAGRLKPEMLATVSVEGTQTVPAVVVPEDAVQLLDGKPVVFVARPDGKGGATFTTREVEVGARADGRVAVMRGLSAGDVVVTRGAFAVKAQLKKGSMPEMEM
jgi:membrane fusion protein, heavy metal efflux system